MGAVTRRGARLRSEGSTTISGSCACAGAANPIPIASPSPRMLLPSAFTIPPRLDEPDPTLHACDLPPPCSSADGGALLMAGRPAHGRASGQARGEERRDVDTTACAA